MTSLTVGQTPRAAGAVLEPAARPLSPRVAEFTVTEWQRRGEPVDAALRRLRVELDARAGKVLSLMLYGTLTARRAIEAALQETLGPVEWPVTWVDARGCDGAELAGVQAFAVSGRPVTRVRVGGRVVASVYDDGEARHCLVGGIGPDATIEPPAAQTEQALANLEVALAAAGFALSDVVRTWFYNDEIVAWYDAFNRVRSARYARVPWRTGSLPASTGIGAGNAAGAALVVAAWAMQPHAATAGAQEIGSPLQCPAPAYGSSFARAMELRSGGLRRLMVSGTASIHPGGATAWIDDPTRQVALTMEVVAAILHARGMDYGDVTRATAYFKAPEFRREFDAWCEEHELRRLPVVSLHAEVCRADLLFEIELDAVAPVANHGSASAAQPQPSGLVNHR